MVPAGKGLLQVQVTDNVSQGGGGKVLNGGAKQAKILEAEAEAEAILKVQQATADAIRLINESDATEEAINKLIAAQRKCEDMYLAFDDEDAE